MKRLEKLVAENRASAPELTRTQYALALERGDTKTAEAALGEILKTVNDPRTPSLDLEWISGEAVPFLARHGKTEVAFQILNRASDAGVPLAYDWLVLDPMLEPLRADARFQKILSRSRARFNETLRLLDQARGRGELPPYLETALDNLVRKLGIR